MYPQYMCILLYVTLIWCNGIPDIHCQLGGRCILSICAFCDMYTLFGITLFHRCVVNWSLGRVDISSVYVHDAIYESYLVKHYSIHLFPIGVGVYVSSVCVHSAICDRYLV